MKKRFSERGFTLMELMVVIVIVAILAAVAVPLYINYVKDARRTEAKGTIAAIISAEQIYYQSNSAYADTSKVKFDPGDAAHNWDFVVSNPGSNGFTVTATGKSGGQTDGLFVQCVYTRDKDPVWTEK